MQVTAKPVVSETTVPIVPTPLPALEVEPEIRELEKRDVAEIARTVTLSTLRDGSVISSRDTTDRFRAMWPTRLRASSMEGAIAAAAMLVGSGGEAHSGGASHAIAVLQSRSGAFYVAPLRRTLPNTSTESAWIDRTSRTVRFGTREYVWTTKHAKALDPALKAIVGHHAIVDFTGKEPTPRYA